MKARRRHRRGEQLLVKHAALCMMALLFAMVQEQCFAQSEAAPSFQTISDFGGVGILQMPSARFSPDGELTFSSGKAAPYFRNAVTFQPVPWFEGILRYTTVLNRDYGAESFSGDQKYKDRSFDFKLKLIEESEFSPQVAVGIRDIGGTGLFSGEYFAFSRRYFDFDFTLGMGWGYTGARGNVKNPFSALSNRFKTRVNNVGQGGTLSAQYFRGENAAIFGGVVWHTPLEGLVAKLELDGNNYQAEPQSNNQKVKSPFNFGFVYRYSDTLDLTLAYERGNTLMAQMVVRGNFQNAKEFPKFDKPAVAIEPRKYGPGVSQATEKPVVGVKLASLRYSMSDAVEQTVEPISNKAKQQLKDQGIIHRGSAVAGNKALVVVEQNRFQSTAKYLGRTVKSIVNELPEAVEEITVRNLEGGLETFNAHLMRKDFENTSFALGSAEEILSNARIAAPNVREGLHPISGDVYPGATWNWSPSMKHHIGGPDNPWFYQFLITAGGELRLTQRLSLTGDVSLNLYNNFDNLKLNSDSKLPHVRSDIKYYLKEGKNSITRLQLDYLGNAGESSYYRLSGGLLEDMFGGIGMEYLFKPYGASWALGADINRVRQRGYSERFDFRDYEVTTGHVDWYYQLPFHNTRFQISAGQYLAGDRGVTFDVSRRFNSGAVLGAFATKTNVSAEQFGEGSFDKGIYVRVPLDLLSLYSSRGNLGTTWRPLTRDGGQRLEVGKRLYPLLKDSGPDAVVRDWARILD